MPSRNTARQDIENSFYHVYARGASKQPVYLDSRDKDFFISLFIRYLSPNQTTGNDGVVYPHYRNRIELLAYCLMENHFHLLIHQTSAGSLSAIMKSIMTSYSSYFNRRYEKSGSLFESRFKASLINSDEYFLHISRYIHLNPRNWKNFRYSSLYSIKNGTEPSWLQTAKLLESYNDRKQYLDFVSDYEDYKRTLDKIKSDLANW